MHEMNSHNTLSFWSEGRHEESTRVQMNAQKIETDISAFAFHLLRGHLMLELSDAAKCDKVLIIEGLSN